MCHSPLRSLFQSIIWLSAFALLLIGQISSAIADPSAGTVFVTDLNGSAQSGLPDGRVLAFDASTGQYLRTVVTGLTVPSAVTVGPGGLLYVTDAANGEVLTYNPSAENKTLADGTVFASGIYTPGGLLYDRQNDSLFVSELLQTNSGFVGENVYHYNANGQLVTSDGTGGVIGVGSGKTGRAGMALDSNQNLYVGAFDNSGSILKFTSGSNYTSYSTFATQAYGPSQMVFHNGNLLVDAQFPGEVLQYNSADNFTSPNLFISLGSSAFNSGLIAHGSNGLLVSSLYSQTGSGQVGLYNIDTGAPLHDGSDSFITVSTLAAANGGSGVPNTNFFQPSSAFTYYLSGDFSMDGSRSAADIKEMLAALTDPSNFESNHDLSSDELSQLGDVNGDGIFNNADLQVLLDDLKADPPAPVPEPSSFVLAGLGLAALALQIRRRMLQ